MDAQRFVKLRSIHKVLFPSEKQKCVYCGNFITYSWFNISSKCTDLSVFFHWEWGGGCSGLCSADSFNCLMVFFSLKQYMWAYSFNLQVILQFFFFTVFFNFYDLNVCLYIYIQPNNFYYFFYWFSLSIQLNEICIQTFTILSFLILIYVTNKIYIVLSSLMRLKGRSGKSFLLGSPATLMTLCHCWRRRPISSPSAPCFTRTLSTARRQEISLTKFTRYKLHFPPHLSNLRSLLILILGF